MTPRARVRLASSVILTTAALGLVGCQGEDDDDPYAVPERFEAYCNQVEDLQATIGDALSTGGDTTGLIKALPSFEKLRAEAPGDIADDWDVVIDRIQGLVDALDAAGLDPSTYDRERPPKDLAPEQRDAIDAAAVALVSTATAEAMSSVQQQARDVCKTPLAL